MRVPEELTGRATGCEAAVGGGRMRVPEELTGRAAGCEAEAGGDRMRISGEQPAVRQMPGGERKS